MSHPRVLRFYGYVDRPYEDVRALVRNRSGDLFQRATHTASTRAEELVSRLSASVGAIEVGTDVRIDVAKQRDEDGVAGMPPVTRLAIHWRAAERASLFPSMSAELSVSPLAFAETRVEFEGTYEPPLGLLGSLLDAAVGHQIAEAAVQRFVTDVIDRIRLELPGPAQRQGLAGAVGVAVALQTRD